MSATGLDAAVGRIADDSCPCALDDSIQRARGEGVGTSRPRETRNLAEFCGDETSSPFNRIHRRRKSGHFLVPMPRYGYLLSAMKEQNPVLNSASQNFPHHLGVLRDRMLHPTDYELAVNYFLEVFAGDAEFVRASDRETMPHLVAVLGHLVSTAVGRAVSLENALVSYLREHRFVHGNAQADGRIVLFFYFQDADTGMMMLIPGVRGEGDVMRFKLKGGLLDPQKN